MRTVEGVIRAQRRLTAHSPSPRPSTQPTQARVEPPRRGLQAGDQSSRPRPPASRRRPGWGGAPPPGPGRWAPTGGGVRARRWRGARRWRWPPGGAPGRRAAWCSTGEGLGHRLPPPRRARAGPWPSGRVPRPPPGHGPDLPAIERGPGQGERDHPIPLPAEQGLRGGAHEGALLTRRGGERGGTPGRAGAARRAAWRGRYPGLAPPAPG